MRRPYYENEPSERYFQKLKYKNLLLYCFSHIKKKVKLQDKRISLEKRNNKQYDTFARSRLFKQFTLYFNKEASMYSLF